MKGKIGRPPYIEDKSLITRLLHSSLCIEFLGIFIPNSCNLSDN